MSLWDRSILFIHAITYFLAPRSRRENGIQFFANRPFFFAILDHSPFLFLFSPLRSVAFSLGLFIVFRSARERNSISAANTQQQTNKQANKCAGEANETLQLHQMHCAQCKSMDLCLGKMVPFLELFLCHT